jgi:hypothetical protein
MANSDLLMLASAAAGVAASLYAQYLYFLKDGFLRGRSQPSEDTGGVRELRLISRRR